MLCDPVVHAFQLETDGGGVIGHFGHGATVAIPPDLGCRSVPCEVENSKFDSSERGERRSYRAETRLKHGDGTPRRPLRL